MSLLMITKIESYILPFKLVEIGNLVIKSIIRFSIDVSIPRKIASYHKAYTLLILRLNKYYIFWYIT